MFAVPRLYAITDLGLAQASSHVDIVRQLLDGGCRCIQVREKALPDAQLYQQLERCLELCAKAVAHLIVNDRVDMAWASGASGVHLGQDDLPPAFARKILPLDCVIGRSTHSLQQAIEAEADKAVDYVAIGPVFATTTKISTNKALGLAGLREVRRIVRKPLVAIGGIDLEKAWAVLETGCDSVAVISALMNAPSIKERTREFLRICH
jgi:thiamine-phosphate pyrophosphorylase